MTPQIVTEYTNRFYNGTLAASEIIAMIAAYNCENKISAIDASEALEYFQKKFHTILLFNNQNQFLKAFNYEEINNSPNGSCKENSTECESLSVKEE